jgi:mannose-6-phosphate isomerase-like protein (cupin superfamily)
MKRIQTTKRTKRGFSVLHRTRAAQAATMTLAPGASSSESSSNEHGWAEQWLYVVSGRGTARVGGRSVKLVPGTMLVIAKHEPHEIKSSPRSRLVTINLYVPPAYDPHGEPLRG